MTLNHMEFYILSANMFLEYLNLAANIYFSWVQIDMTVILS